MTAFSFRRQRDRTAFVFRRIPLPDCLIKDAWWLGMRATVTARQACKGAQQRLSTKRAISHD